MKELVTIVVLIVAPLIVSSCGTSRADNSDWAICREEHRTDAKRRLDACSAAIQQRSHVADALFFRAQLHEQLGDDPSAIADYTSAFAEDPNDVAAIVNRGTVFLSNGEGDRALADFDMAVRIDPNNSVAHLQRGVARARAGDDVGAVDDYDTVILLDPTMISAFLNRGIANVRLRRIDQAIADYSAAIEMNPLYAKAYNGRCWARLIGGSDLLIALDDCNRSLAIEPSDSAARDSRAMVHLALENYDLALADYDAVLAAEPRNVDALYGRGLALVGAQRAIEGRADMASAVARDSQVSRRFDEYLSARNRASQPP
jgi:tetratricopeptide (TPR) repeat protein